MNFVFAKMVATALYQRLEILFATVLNSTLESFVKVGNVGIIVSMVAHVKIVILIINQYLNVKTASVRQDHLEYDVQNCKRVYLPVQIYPPS